MEEKEMENIINDIKEKIGEDNTGLISDTLGKIVTANTNLNTQINTLNTQIDTLNETNTNLQKANANLLQQITVNTINNSNYERNEEKEISFDEIFDDKGNFK